MEQQMANQNVLMASNNAIAIHEVSIATRIAKGAEPTRKKS